jgi:hypothetical protein
MKRFREQRARDAYKSTLSNLLASPDTSPPTGEPAAPSEVQQWLQMHGTGPLATLKISAPVVQVTPAQPTDSAPDVSSEAVQAAPEPITNNQVAL